MTKTDASRLLSRCAQLLFTAALVAGCGGGGSGGSSSPAKSSFTAGPITATNSGSVVVKDTTFDVSSAKVADDDDRARGEGDLKVGMLAEIEGGEITADTTGSRCNATNVTFRSAIIGPVDAINTSTRLLVVLGQTIDVLDTTVFDDRFPNGPFGIVVGDIIEIFGTLDTSTGHYVATRIEPAGDAPFFKLRGVVANLDIRARTFTIGGETISFARVPPHEIPAGLANGSLVTVKLQKEMAGGAWIAVTFQNAVHQLAEHNEIKLKGRISDVLSATQFSVAGIPVDARSAKVRPDGATIFLGADVEVEGTVTNGIVIATKVEIEKDDEHGHGNKHENEHEDEHEDDNEHKNKD